MKLVIGSLIASVVCFFWGYLSWTVMSWHENGVHGFHEEETMAGMFTKNAQAGHAIYRMPMPGHAQKGALPEERKAVEDKFQQAMDDGPYVYAVVRPGKVRYSEGNNIIMSVVRSFIAALLLAVILDLATIPYMARVAVCAAAGLFAGVVADLPMWIWFEWPTRDILVGMVDHVIEWTLGGLALAGFAGKNPTAKHERQH
ncbi:MAG: hypothetical protein K1X78_25680 [Verrucomicrobiaceae bacterium]|nr:hypothetical protein [Verrucomicrobiaceae bacterium]